MLKIYEEAWAVKTVTVVKSSKKCVIVNAFDGIEDEVLFEEC